MNTAKHQEQLNHEKFLLALLTEECKICKAIDLSGWWSWRDLQFVKVARLVTECNAPG